MIEVRDLYKSFNNLEVIKSVNQNFNLFPNMTVLENVMSEPKIIKKMKSEKAEEIAKMGMTMIIVTHEMAFANEVSDKVVFLSEGKVAEIGTPNEIFNNPKHEKLQSFLSSINLAQAI